MICYVILFCNLLMNSNGAAHFPHNMRIDDILKSNQSINYSEFESNSHCFNTSLANNPYGAQIYLQSQKQDKLLSKFFLLCLELQRLTKLAQTHETIIINLRQQIQIRIADTQSYREKETILQTQIKKIQEEDKALLINNHKLEQILLEKNRLTSMLEQEVVMTKNKLNNMHPKENTEHKNKIRELQQVVLIQKNKVKDLDRQLKQSVINLERFQIRMNTKVESDRNLLMNSQFRIKELEQQLRAYIQQKRILQQNQLKFSERQINIQQSRSAQLQQNLQKLLVINSELSKQKNKAKQQISHLEFKIKDLEQQSKNKLNYQTEYQKNILTMQRKMQSLTKSLQENERKLIFITNQKSDIIIRLQSTSQELKKVQQKNDQLRNQKCFSCHRLSNSNEGLLLQLQKLQKQIFQKEDQHKKIMQKSQKQLKNMRLLLQSINNLKGSHDRVSRLIQSSSTKLMRTTSSKGFFSASTF